MAWEKGEIVTIENVLLIMMVLIVVFGIIVIYTGSLGQDIRTPGKVTEVMSHKVIISIESPEEANLVRTRIDSRMYEVQQDLDILSEMILA